MKENNSFSYTYSAPTEAERREINAIRERYAKDTGDNATMARLRALDARVRNIPAAVSLILGVTGTLIFGFGLAAILEWGMICFGIITAVIGAVPVGLAYPTHRAIQHRMERKYGEEIVRLSDTLLGRSDAD